MLENVLVVAISLLIGGIIFLLLDKWFATAEENGTSELSSNTKSGKNWSVPGDRNDSRSFQICGNYNRWFDARIE